MEVAEFFGAEVGHTFTRLLRQTRQTRDGPRFKRQPHAVLGLEFPSERGDLGDDTRVAHRSRFGENRGKRRGGIGDECGSDLQLRHTRAGQLEFEMTQEPLAHGHESACAGLFPGRGLGDGVKGLVGEFGADAIGFELALVLADETALGVLHDLEEIAGREHLADDPHGETSDELGLEAEVDEILGDGLARALGGFFRSIFSRRDEADRPLTETPVHDLLESGESTADDEKNVARIDRLAGGLASVAAHLEHGLHLRLHVLRIAHRHLGFLHQLQQGRLHPASADIASSDIRGTRDLVDLVEVNDAVLGELDVAIGLAHELAHEIINIAADITGLGEFRRIGLHERHADEFGDVFDEVGFPDTGGTDDDDILLRELNPLCLDRIGLSEPLEVGGVVVVITHSDGEGLFRFVLPDHVTVEVILDLARDEVEIKFGGKGRVAPQIVILASRGRGLTEGRTRLGHGAEGNVVAETGAQEVAELACDFLGIGKGSLVVVFAWHIVEVTSRRNQGDYKIAMIFDRSGQRKRCTSAHRFANSGSAAASSSALAATSGACPVKKPK